MAKKRKELELWQKADAARLLEIYDAKIKLSQDSFGATREIGSQAMVWQYLHGYTALNHRAAYAFAKALRCKVNDFSPRLAGEIAMFAEYVAPKSKVDVMATANQKHSEKTKA